MNKDSLKNIVLVLLLGITIFSMVKYVSELNARYQLQNSLAQARNEIILIAQEKQNLLQELRKEKEIQEELALRNAALKDNLRASNQRIIRFFQENTKIKEDLGSSGARLSILKAENRALIDGHKRLYVENEGYKLKLSSIEQLKKAIKDLKNRKRKNMEAAVEGNQGFIIKNGRSTAVDKIKIEVVPVQAKN
jgi:uncharacterized protein (DUF3084 family)